MRVIRSIRRRVSTVLGCRICVPAAVALCIAAAGVGYGLTHDDVVTALGALLFVPSAAILFGVAVRRNGSERVPGDRRAN
jgi:uncharacterized membrane protein